MGKLLNRPGVCVPLSSAYPDPAQISFTPNGHAPVVAEKTTDTIDTYALGSDSRALGGWYRYVLGIALTDATTRGVQALRPEDDGSLQEMDFAMVSGYAALARLASR